MAAVVGRRGKNSRLESGTDTFLCFAGWDGGYGVGGFIGFAGIKPIRPADIMPV